jgi:hypothetical protein
MYIPVAQDKNMVHLYSPEDKRYIHLYSLGDIRYDKSLESAE